MKKFIKIAAIMFAVIVMIGTFSTATTTTYAVAEEVETESVPTSTPITKTITEGIEVIAEIPEIIEQEDFEEELPPVLQFGEIGFIPGETLAGDIYEEGYEFVPNGYYYTKDGVRLNLVTNEPLIDASMGLADNDPVYAIGIDVENAKYVPDSTIPFGDTLDDLVSLYGEPTVQSEYGKYQYLRYEFDGYSIDLKIHIKKGLIQYTYNAVPVIYG